MENIFKWRRTHYGEDFEYLVFFNKMSLIFGSTIVNSLITSVILYPLDTLKRQIQVNGSFGYKHEYVNYKDAINKFSKSGLANMYRGFSLHLIGKAVPYSFLHYTFYSSVLQYYSEDYST